MIVGETTCGRRKKKSIKGCYKIKRFVNQQKQIPYMSIETDYSQADVGQINTRTAVTITI
jgi:benzoyl-CoA reductase/2-hydroxyglutaryl-CoA dehydratase subunit BcrC/BadD/HgdB